MENDFLKKIIKKTKQLVICASFIFCLNNYNIITKIVQIKC